ncbi:nuclear transport factor 2 family protein [Caulobacter sp. 17J80-11]|uniref:nuclear transport factor 2 family protein n=1 Tax=Caulobacter sp. 17J80-11 TaxID=2763502 RepID=UPI00165367E6|nr:nuclear transport factor 2 family protein [Caulobacter sp. 17J80-11]MBC6981936.1 nuclear transport factor 2 family protein [Caulobacter sp. 17J80-11]
MTAPEDAIRARRKLTNKLIAAHEAARLRPFFAPDMKLIAGDGSLILGADEVVAAFDAQFRDPTFVAYLRTPETVTLDDEGARAAESGRWVGTWKDQQQSGTYLATWRKVLGQWLLENELFVTLDQGG